MAHVLKALVGESSTTTGTGAFTLDAALTDHRRFSTVCATSDTTEVMIRHATDGSWAHCRATYSAANELTLTETVESSTGSAISWAAGNKTVVLAPLARSIGVGPDNTATLSNKTLVDPVMVGTAVEDVFTITDGASVDINPSNGSIQLWTLGASRTPIAPTNFQAGQSVTLMILDGTAYTITWTSVAVTWVGGSAPTLDTTKYTIVELWKVGSTIYGSSPGAA